MLMLQLSPYFKAIARRPHFCPECGGPLKLKPLELTWDGAVWKCEACHWFQLEVAPEAAKLGQRDARGEEPGRRARNVGVDFGRGRK